MLDLKRRLAREWPLPAGQQRLTIPALRARELCDEETLEAAGCRAGGVYRVSCAPPCTP